MKFREYGDVRCKVFMSNSPYLIESYIDSFGEKNDIIDLQFSSHSIKEGETKLVVLILYKKGETK